MIQNINIHNIPIIICELYCNNKKYPNSYTVFKVLVN